MKLRRCTCRQCRRAAKTKFGKFFIRSLKKRHRHATRHQLKAGKYDKVVNAISVPYLG